MFVCAEAQSAALIAGLCASIPMHDRMWLPRDLLESEAVETNEQRLATLLTVPHLTLGMAVQLLTATGFRYYEWVFVV